MTDPNTLIIHNQFYSKNRRRINSFDEDSESYLYYAILGSLRKFSKNTPTMIHHAPERSLIIKNSLKCDYPSKFETRIFETHLQLSTLKFAENAERCNKLWTIRE